MRALKTLLAAVALVGMTQMTVGCGAQPGTTIITQGANAEPVMGNAPASAEYMLFTAMSPNPTATVRLKSGDPLGFRRSDDGHLVAVAGEQTFDLPKGTSQAYWKQQK